MAENKYEYLIELAESIQKAFDTSTYSNLGQIEQYNLEIELLKQGLSVTLALLINHNIIKEDQLKSLLENGFLIKEVKP